MATGTYRGVTVQTSDEVAKGLPATFNMKVAGSQPVRATTAGEQSVEPEGSSASQSVKAPAKTASRGDWAKYAESVGIDPGDMTRAELIKATGN